MLEHIAAAPLADSYACEDGTVYAVHSELIRGESRFYWVMVQLPRECARNVNDGRDGSHDRRTQQRRARRLAAAHNAGQRVVSSAATI
jgi:hypothetical protein